MTLPRNRRVVAAIALAMLASSALPMLASSALPMLALSAQAASPPSLLQLDTEGGDFRARLSDGQVLRGADLVGATLDIAGPDGIVLHLTIASAEPDRGGAAPDVWLFDLVQPVDGGPAQHLCSADPEGRHLAIPHPVAGATGGLALTCSSGAVGKCMRFGYRPWANAADGLSLAPLHAACVHMVRADYGGDDRPWTRNGMTIDLYDDHGIQQPAANNAMPFEAGWSPAGAVCIAHVRVPENGGLHDVAAATPRLVGRTGPEACTEATARAAGAVLFNRSRGL